MEKIKKQAHRVYCKRGEGGSPLFFLTRLTYLCQFSDTSSHDNVSHSPPPFFALRGPPPFGISRAIFHLSKMCPKFPPSQDTGGGGGGNRPIKAPMHFPSEEKDTYSRTKVIAQDGVFLARPYLLLWRTYLCPLPGG